MQINATKLLNLLGKVVLTKQAEAKKTMVDITNLNSGIYLMKIKYRNGQTETKRITIQ
jgi:hypothetical protein